MYHMMHAVTFQAGWHLHPLTLLAHMLSDMTPQASQLAPASLH
jgi:hypothetical protein